MSDCETLNGRPVEGGGGDGSTTDCLNVYLVSPNPGGAPFSTIQAAYQAAKDAGHGPANPAKILVCPGTYSGALLLDRAGIDVIAVAQDSQQAQGGGGLNAATPPGRTVFTGNLTIDPVFAGSRDATSLRWQGIDMVPTTGIALLFGGTNNAWCYIYVSDCIIRSPDGTAVSVTNTGNDGLFSASVIDFQRCSLEANGAAQVALLMVVAASPFPSAFLSGCRLFGLGEAIRLDGGGVALESCQVNGIETAISMVVGSTIANDCYLGSGPTALVASGAGTVFIATDCYVEFPGLGPFVTGSGLFLHDALTFRAGSPPWDTNLVVQTTQAVPFEQFGDRPLIVGTYEITSEISLAVLGLPPGPNTLLLPPGNSRPGPIVVKLDSASPAAVSLAGQGGNLIRLGGSAPAASVPITTDGFMVVFNSLTGFWEGWSFSATNCLSRFLVAPSSAYAPYTSIQAAYNAAKAAGASPTSPAKVLVCPGIYTENILMDTAGIDIVAVEEQPYNQRRGYYGQGTTILRGQVVINLTLGAQPLPNPRSCAWRGIDIDRAGEALQTPSLYFTGTNFQRAYVSDCRIVSSGGAGAIQGDNSGNGGGALGDSVLDLVQCGITQSQGANGAGPATIDWDDSRLELSGCRVFANSSGPSMDQQAGSTVYATDCRISGLWGTRGLTWWNQCSYRGTIDLLDADAVVDVLNCELDSGGPTTPGGLLLVNGIGIFRYDQIPWQLGVKGTIAVTVQQQQKESTPPGSFYVAAGAVFTMTTESNVVATVAGGVITIPPATARQGPIRLKNNSGGAATAQPPANTQINGGGLGVGVAIPAAGFTLVPDGVNNWESFA